MRCEPEHPIQPHHISHTAAQSTKLQIDEARWRNDRGERKRRWTHRIIYISRVFILRIHYTQSRRLAHSHKQTRAHTHRQCIMCTVNTKFAQTTTSKLFVREYITILFFGGRRRRRRRRCWCHCNSHSPSPVRSSIPMLSLQFQKPLAHISHILNWHLAYSVRECVCVCSTALCE